MVQRMLVIVVQLAVVEDQSRQAETPAHNLKAHLFSSPLQRGRTQCTVQFIRQAMGENASAQKGFYGRIPFRRDGEISPGCNRNTQSHAI